MSKQRFAERLTGNLPLERGGGGGDDLMAGISNAADDIIPSLIVNYEL
jgi:hypothetical protein